LKSDKKEKRQQDAIVWKDAAVADAEEIHHHQ